MAKKNFYVNADFWNNQLVRAVVENSAIAPTLNIKKGQLYFSTAIDVTAGTRANELYWYDGTQWLSAKGVFQSLTSGTPTNILVTQPTPGNYVISLDQAGILHANLDGGVTVQNNPHKVGLSHATNINSDAGGKVISNALPATQANDLVTKSQLDSVGIGFKWADPAKVASTGDIDLATGTLLTIDGILLAAGDRVCVKDQIVPSANGVYLANAGTWPRSGDMNDSAEFIAFTLRIEEGDTQGGFTYTQTNAITNVGTDDVKWVKVSGTNIEAGSGMTDTGVVINVNAAIPAGIGTDPPGGGIVVYADSVGFDAVNAAGIALAVNATDDWKLDVKVDNSTINVTSNEIGVAAAGITSREVSEDVAGDGLTGGGQALIPAPLEVQPFTNAADDNLMPIHVGDGNPGNIGVAVPIDNDTIKHRSNGAGGRELFVNPEASGLVNKYTNWVNLPAGVATIVTHGLTTKFIIAQVWQANGGTSSELIEVYIESVDDSSIQITSHVELLSAYVTVIG